MHLSCLELTDFRSYPTLRLAPEPGVNVLIGRNGAGKTNILESIAYLSSLKSFRRAPDVALIRAGAEAAVARGAFTSKNGVTDVGVEIPRLGRRRVLVNGKRPSRLSEVASVAPVVAFLPDDLDLVKRGPGLRREYLDDLGAQLVPAVGADQREFEKALRQRNALLRQSGRTVDTLTLDVWDERVAVTGGRVLANRIRLIGRLADDLQRAYVTVGGDPGQVLHFAYGCRWVDVAPGGEPDAAGFSAALAEVLGERRRRDMDQRTTTAGPHRDDPGLVLDGRDVRVQASQGEQRSVTLSLRLVAYGMLEQRYGRPPVLLLDDVFSELDEGRAMGVKDLLPRGQVFVTSARDDEVPDIGRRWHVGNGEVI